MACWNHGSDDYYEDDDGDEEVRSAPLTANADRTNEGVMCEQATSNNLNMNRTTGRAAPSRTDKDGSDEEVREERTTTTPLVPTCQWPAYAYIFNHVTFNDPKYQERVGTEKDVEALKETFVEFQMKVHVIENPCKDEVVETIGTIKTTDFSRHSYLVIVILSHGTRHDKILARDKDYSIHDDVIFPILSNKTLADKPKLFFIQACKGDKEFGYESDGTSSSRVESPRKLLIFYSTFEGGVSYRCRLNGSIFITALCDFLKRHGRDEDIKDIINKVQKALQDEEYGALQYPASYGTLIDRFCFGDYLNAKS